MASMRPNPASPSDDPPAIPLGVRVERKHAIGAPGQPGTIRVVAMRGDGVVELEGTAAMAGMAELLGEPEAARSGSISSPRRQAQAQKVGEALSLHPLIVEDVLEGNQRAKIETTDGIVHIVLFHLSYGDAVVASELDIVLGDGLPADRPQRRLGPARPVTTWRMAWRPSWRTARTTSCGRSRTT